MTPNEFRKVALSFPEAIESAHMSHPDFRVAGKIFATLGYPDDKSAMVKLSADEQREFIRTNPGIFTPAKGAWGRQGATTVNLSKATIDVVRAALTSAWRDTAPKRLTRNR